MANPLPSFDELHRLLTYAPDTGIFTWKPRVPTATMDEHQTKVWNSRFAGKQAGCYTDRYGLIGVNNRLHKASRLAFVYQTGHEPSGIVDHINGDRYDDRWINLHDISRKDNSKNQKLSKSNSSGRTGVHLQRGKFLALIKVDGKSHGIYFSTFEEAVAQREAWEQQYVGDLVRGSGRINPYCKGD